MYKHIPYMVVTIDVHQAFESNTVLAVFNAVRNHPITIVGPTFGLYCKHFTNVHKFNLKTNTTQHCLPEIRRETRKMT